MPAPIKGFLALPAEIRNEIYGLAFTDNAVEPINLCHAYPPSKALLLTCHQINNEAAGIYRDANKSYWYVVNSHMRASLLISHNSLSHRKTSLEYD